MSFAFPADGPPRHFLGGDLLQSHLAALGSAVFPEGEDFFVRSVRAYRDAITDPELRRQVAGFIGQEAMHGRSHRVFNRRLAALGYPTGVVDRATRVSLRLAERVLPAHVALAITAALEHYTATLAEALLTDEGAQAAYLDDEVRALYLWHALEESEHKAVAFDVFQAVSGSHAVRVWVMRLTTLSVLAGGLVGLVVSLARDPAARDLRRLRASVAALRTSPMAQPWVGERLRDYGRRDFHPDDHDTSALVDRWRRQLVAADGTLAPPNSKPGAAPR